MTKTKEIFFEQAQGACKRGTAAMLCIILALAASSCVKQRNCDCGQTGTFVYLKEPYEVTTNCTTREKIVAEFIVDKGPAQYITGYVPHKFQSGDSIRVRLCSKYVCEDKLVTMDLRPKVFTLKCIERE
ncbi:MAG: hypothetical protein LBK03_04215 [Bacteroidales bacterium]|jgi:hypothetical protein|nr:hypothetical protein [Bacteroidales bacterium]